MPRPRRSAYRDGRATRALAAAVAVLAWASATAAPAEPAAPPIVEERTLASGLRLVVERRPGAPRVAIELAWPGGRAAEPAGRVGGTAVLAAAITAACQPEAVDGGGALAARAGRWHLAVRGSWPAAAWRDGLRTARSCPASAGVGGELVAARERVARDVALVRVSPTHRAAALVARARWGAHPLGLDPHRDAGPAGLDATALRAHQAAQLAVAPIVVVVGDVALDDLAAELDAAGPWSAPPRLTARLAPEPPARRQVFVEHATDGAAVAIALPAVAATDADRAALEVLAAILAGPAGPLAAARDGAMLTVALPDGADLGGLVLGLTAPPPLTPRVAMLEQALAALAADGPDPAAVERARARLLAEHDRPELRAAALARAALTGAADPRTALTAVDVAAVARVAATTLRWDQVVLATVQPADRSPAVDRLLHRPGRAPHRRRRPVRPRPRTPDRRAGA